MVFFKKLLLKDNEIEGISENLAVYLNIDQSYLIYLYNTIVIEDLIPEFVEKIN